MTSSEVRGSIPTPSISTLLYPEVHEAPYGAGRTTRTLNSSPTKYLIVFGYYLIDRSIWVFDQIPNNILSNIIWSNTLKYLKYCILFGYLFDYLVFDDAASGPITASKIDLNRLCTKISLSDLQCRVEDLFKNSEASHIRLLQRKYIDLTKWYNRPLPTSYIPPQPIPTLPQTSGSVPTPPIDEEARSPSLEKPVSKVRANHKFKCATTMINEFSRSVYHPMVRDALRDFPVKKGLLWNWAYWTK